MNVRITGIAGSLRRESFNRKLLHAAAHEMPHGAELTVWDGLGAVPPFSEDLEAAPAPAGVTDLRQVIAEADGLLFATPEYNGSVPGQLKNAIDWASRPPRGDRPRRAGADGGTGASRGPARLCRRPHHRRRAALHRHQALANRTRTREYPPKLVYVDSDLGHAGCCITGCSAVGGSQAGLRSDNADILHRLDSQAGHQRL